MRTSRGISRLDRPLACTRQELADQMLREVLQIYLIDLSYTPEMVIAIIGPIMGGMT